MSDITTMAIGEEDPTTLALGEEHGIPSIPYTTMAVGEEELSSDGGFGGGFGSPFGGF